MTDQISSPPKTKMKHNCPVHREVAAYLPSAKQPLNRAQVRSLMDSVCAEANRFVNLVEMALKAAFPDGNVATEEKDTLRRVMDTTERVDFPQFMVALSERRAILVRSCLTACSQRIDGPGRHKVWSRFQLVEKSSDCFRPALGLAVDEVIDFYEAAKIAGYKVREELWPEFAKFAAEKIGGLSYDEKNVKMLKIEFDESDDDRVFQTVDRLRRGVPLAEVAGSTNLPGYPMFIDMLRIANSNKKSDLGLQELKNFVKDKDVQVSGFRPPYLQDPTYFFERTQKDGTIQIWGTGYAVELADELKGSVSGRLSFISSRDYMTIRGGKI